LIKKILGGGTRETKAGCPLALFVCFPRLYMRFKPAEIDTEIKLVKKKYGERIAKWKWKHCVVLDVNK